MFGLFGKKKKQLKQDLSQAEKTAGAPVLIHLLMEEKCRMPEKDFMCRVMNSHLGETDCFTHSNEMAGFAPKRALIDFEKQKLQVPPQLMIMSGLKIEKPVLDEVAASQTWNCPNSAEILSSCKYQVIANDLLGAQLNYKERAEMLVDFAEAMVEMFPTCKAVVFGNSGKMFAREDILNCTMPKESRFIYYAVNVRFFNIQNSNEKIIDTLGMSTLFLPDLQYHFHDLEPNAVVNHAYNVLSYIFDNENPIKSGEHIDGLKDGEMSEEVQWNVQYENSLIQPAREVLDVHTGEFAAGDR